MEKNLPRCYICQWQRRHEDLLPDFKRECLLCDKVFCFPHHSANPVEIGQKSVKRCLYVLYWQEHSHGRIHEIRIPSNHLCIVCGLQPPKKILSHIEYLNLKKKIWNLKIEEFFQEEPGDSIPAVSLTPAK